MCVTLLSTPPLTAAVLTTNIVDGVSDHAQGEQPRRHRNHRKPNPDLTRAKTKAEHLKILLFPSPPDGNGNTLFVSTTNLDPYLTESLHTVLLFSQHRDPRSPHDRWNINCRGTRVALG